MQLQFTDSLPLGSKVAFDQNHVRYRAAFFLRALDRFGLFTTSVKRCLLTSCYLNEGMDPHSSL